MNALEFFTRHSGLRDLKPESRQWRDGTCSSCDAATAVTKIGKNWVCDRCVPLRIAYPADAKPLRLGKGSFALVTESRSIFWTIHHLDQISNQIEVRSAKGNQATILKDLMLNPPDEPYVFVVFGPSNCGRDLVLNRSPDTVQISCYPLVTIGPVPISGVNRRQLLELIQLQPDLSGKDWHALIRAQAKLLDFKQTPEQAVETGRLLEKYPNLDRRLPWLNTPEHLMLKQITT